jgi:Domain of unknown function (DUF4386)
MTPLRRTAAIAGGLYVATFITSIPALLLLKGTVLGDPGYILGPGSDSTVVLACILDMLNAITAVGTAVVLFPVVRRQNLALALGFVTSRLFEAAVIVIGVVSLLGLVTLRQNWAGAAGPDDATATAIGQALVAVRDWTFLLGPGVVPGINALLIGTLMYRSGLVPRWMPVLGLVAGPLLLISAIFTLFGVFGQTSGAGAIFGAPIFVWELSFGLYMLIKGFKPSPITATTEPDPVLAKV